MRKYGIPYKGSKSKIAEDILTALPAGRRLVDLFGGGFAITDCALRMFAWKWEKFFWNDIDPLLPPLIYGAIEGKYSEPNFHPVWISREDFKRLKDSDGYVKWIWSFGNNGNDYLYSRKIEEGKRKAFEFIVNGTPSDITEGITLEGRTINDRRIEWMRKLNGGDKHNDSLERLQSLAQLHSLERLQPLAQLQSLERLQPLASMDYHDYQYVEGDVVYCDIPYQDAINPKDYGGGFDHAEFFRWAKSRPYPVYVSSYARGQVVWQKRVISPMNTGRGQVARMETLFKVLH